MIWAGRYLQPDRPGSGVSNRSYPLSIENATIPLSGGSCFQIEWFIYTFDPSITVRWVTPTIQPSSNHFFAHKRKKHITYLYQLSWSLYNLCYSTAVRLISLCVLQWKHLDGVEGGESNKSQHVFHQARQKKSNLALVWQQKCDKNYPKKDGKNHRSQLPSAKGATGEPTTTKN